MKVKCIANKGSFLPNDLLTHRSFFTKDTKFALVCGKEYVVYAMTLHMGYVWYYICDGDFTYYPIWKPSPLFDVIDGRISRYWHYWTIRYPEGQSDLAYVTWAYKEWARDLWNYYGALTDGEEQAVKIFKKYKSLMDLEFPDTTVSAKYTATLSSDKQWFICPECFESWSSQSSDGMVECPKCKLILHNPLFGI